MTCDAPVSARNIAWVVDACYTCDVGREAMRKLKGKPANRIDRHANIVRRKAFSAEDLMKHLDPGPRGEAEEFVRLICEQRRQDRERALPE